MDYYKLIKSFFPRHCFSRTVQLDPKTEIVGFVFIGSNVSVGDSKIIASEKYIISIGKDTNIRNNVLISAGNASSNSLTNAYDVFIGSRVFISSDVVINGPSIVSDSCFIGRGTKIFNSIIGPKCLIEGDVLLKDVIIPSDVVIPRGAVIDSIDKLQKLLLEQLNNISYCAINH